MSSGPADGAAEDVLYRAVWRAVYDLHTRYELREVRDPSAA